MAISSRALFDFEEENRVFERDGEDAYVTLQLGRLDTPAKRGVAFPLVQKLLAKEQWGEMDALFNGLSAPALRLAKEALLSSPDAAEHLVEEAGFGGGHG